MVLGLFALSLVARPWEWLKDVPSTGIPGLDLLIVGLAFLALPAAMFLFVLAFRTD